MAFGLNWKDYVWTAVVLLAFFVLLPLGLWGWSEYREVQVKHKGEQMLPDVFAKTDASFTQVAQLLDQEANRIGAADRATTSMNKEIQRVCDVVRNSIHEQDEGFLLNQWNCIFFLSKKDVVYRGGVTYTQRLSGLDSNQTIRFEALKQADKKWILHDEYQGYWVSYLVQINPEVIFDFYLEPADRDY